MVKGVAKHAVIVRPQEGREFEQAIFILNDTEEAPVRTPEEMLSLAGDLAAKYAVPLVPPRRRRAVPDLWRAVMYFLCGSALTGLIWWYVASGM